jgi:hypothetical protein
MPEQTPKPASEEAAAGERKDIRRAIDETEAPVRVEIPKDDEPRSKPPDDTPTPRP